MCREQLVRLTSHSPLCQHVLILHSRLITMKPLLTTLILLWPLTCLAQQGPGNSLSEDDFRHLNQTTVSFNNCVSENAPIYLEKYDDVREAAGYTIEHCEIHFTKLRAQLGDKSTTPYYNGIERHMKNRAIRKLLPMMMYHKSTMRETSQ